jgi:hypothetical protein
MTSDQVRPLLARLSLAFGQPYGLTASSADELTATWVNVVGDCEIRDLSTAVDQWIRTQKKWPVPAMIREDAWQLTRARRPTRPASSGFCLRCHATDLIDLPNGRFMPLHDENCPGLHETDRLELRHALATNRTIWHDGSPPKPRLISEAADD